MDAVQELLELNQLHRLKAAYFRFYDTQDWDNWLSLFAENATLIAEHELIWAKYPTQPPLRLAGRQAIHDYIVPISAQRHTVHHGHTPEIDLLSEATATGIWAMEDIIEYADRRIHGHGHYFESYRKVDAQWRFASVHLKRLRLTMVERDPAGPGADDVISI